MEHLPQRIQEYLDKQHPRYIQWLKELAQIPAPSGQEHQRAEWCKKHLEELGATGVYIDSACNVVFPYYAENNNQLTVFNAHLDVVFPDTTPLPLVEDGNILRAPGVGDDTANVIAVMEMAGMAIELGLKPKEGILFVLNSCEEGLGNLKGIRQLMKDYEGRIKQVFAIDGGYHHYVNDAVGSKRYEITIETEGGHSFGSFGNRNAIYYMAKLIDTLYSLKVPDIGKTTYNVGLIEGGTSINTIAQSCTMKYEYRSNQRQGLAYMDTFFESVLASYRNMGIELKCNLVGDRPCKGDIEPIDQSRLIEEVVALYGVTIEPESGSTDCNIPLSLGIPAICFGVYEGSGAHTREEYLDIQSTILGRKILAQIVLEQMQSDTAQHH